MQFIHLSQTTSKVTSSITVILLVPPSSPSPERIDEGVGESLLEMKHIVSVEIRHAPWVATTEIVVVAAYLSGVSLKFAAKVCFAGPLYDFAPRVLSRIGPAPGPQGPHDEVTA
jgi:hypothetical protein